MMCSDYSFVLGKQQYLMFLQKLGSLNEPQKVKRSDVRSMTINQGAAPDNIQVESDIWSIGNSYHSYHSLSNVGDDMMRKTRNPSDDST